MASNEKTAAVVENSLPTDQTTPEAGPGHPDQERLG